MIYTNVFVETTDSGVSGSRGVIIFWLETRGSHVSTGYNYLVMNDLQKTHCRDDRFGRLGVGFGDARVARLYGVTICDGKI